MPHEIITERIDSIAKIVRSFKKGEKLLPVHFPASTIQATSYPPSFPDDTIFYDKSIIVFIPHLQFPNLTIPCNNKDDKTGKVCTGVD